MVLRHLLSPCTSPCASAIHPTDVRRMRQAQRMHSERNIAVRLEIRAAANLIEVAVHATRKWMRFRDMQLTIEVDPSSPLDQLRSSHNAQLPFYRQCSHEVAARPLCDSRESPGQTFILGISRNSSCCAPQRIRSWLRIRLIPSSKVVH